MTERGLLEDFEGEGKSCPCGNWSIWVGALKLGKWPKEMPGTTSVSPEQCSLRNSKDALPQVQDVW